MGGGGGEGGFIILLIFVVPSQGTGRCMYRIPGSAPGHHFLWGGTGQGVPTHQPAFSFDQTKHQTLTDALCHVLLYIDQIVRNA